MTIFNFFLAISLFSLSFSSVVLAESYSTDAFFDGNIGFPGSLSDEGSRIVRDFLKQVRGTGFIIEVNVKGGLEPSHRQLVILRAFMLEMEDWSRLAPVGAVRRAKTGGITKKERAMMGILDRSGTVSIEVFKK